MVDYQLWYYVIIMVWYVHFLLIFTGVTCGKPVEYSYITFLCKVRTLRRFTLCCGWLYQLCTGDAINHNNDQLFLAESWGPSTDTCHYCSFTVRRRQNFGLILEAGHTVWAQFTVP